MSFHSTNVLKFSRKGYQCAGSLAWIPAGSAYVRYSGVYEGDFYTVAMLPAVAEIYERRSEAYAKRHRYSDCLTFDELIDDIFEDMQTTQDLTDAEVFQSVNPQEWRLNRINAYKVKHFQPEGAAK